MNTELAGDVHRLLAADPDLAFRESALVKQLNQERRALGRVLDQLERAGVVVSCRIQCPGKPDDREVRISVLGTKAMSTKNLLPDAKYQVITHQHRMRSRLARKGGNVGLKEAGIRRRQENLATRLGSSFRPQTGEVRCAGCLAWLDQGHFSGRVLASAKEPKCEICMERIRVRKSGASRVRHHSARV